MNKSIYVLKNINKYIDKEEFFHVTLFTNYENAIIQLNKDYYTAVQNWFDSLNVNDIYKVSGSYAELNVAGHIFTWEVEQHEVDI